MQQIAGILIKRIKQSGLVAGVQNALIIEEFQKLLSAKYGRAFAAKVKPLYLKNNKLTVSCGNSALLQEMSFFKSELLRQLNKKFGQAVLSDIRLII